jgi:hypothetical protein
MLTSIVVERHHHFGYRSLGCQYCEESIVGQVHLRCKSNYLTYVLETVVASHMVTNTLFPVATRRNPRSLCQRGLPHRTLRFDLPGGNPTIPRPTQDHQPAPHPYRGSPWVSLQYCWLLRPGRPWSFTWRWRTRTWRRTRSRA